MVDNGSIVYYTKKSIKDITDLTTHFFECDLEFEGQRVFLKTPKKKGYEFINFVGLSLYRGKTKIVISFSYSKYPDKRDNYKLCENEKTIQAVHTRIIQIIQAITGELVLKKDVGIAGLDISNQFEINTREYYQVLNLIFRAIEKQLKGTLYFNTTNDNRKELQGFSIFESGTGKKEAKTFFKIYNKFKEREETGRREAGQVQALRGELSLKQSQLKRLKLESIDCVNREVLDSIYLATISKVLRENLERVIKEDIEELKRAAANFNKIDFLKLEYLIFDVDILKTVLTEETTGLKERTCFYHKKSIIEELDKLEAVGEIVKVYKRNFERLKKIVKKLFKLDLKISCSKKGVMLEWLDLPKSRK